MYLPWLKLSRPKYEPLPRQQPRGSGKGTTVGNGRWVRRCAWNIVGIVLLLALIDLIIYRDRILKSYADRLITNFGPSTYQKLDGEWGHASNSTSEHAPGMARPRRADSALIMLCRNEDLDGVVSAIHELETAFNSKFNYPWILFNEVPFTEEFIAHTKHLTRGSIQYEKIPAEHWDVPASIDMEEFHLAAERLKSQNVKYASSLSYRQMCRWNSGFFYKHPALSKLKYYWRVEPDVEFYSDISYDPFQYMADNNLTYGFNLAVLDTPRSITSLWPTTLEFLSKSNHPMHANNSWSWLISDTINSDIANGYSTCHFWSNFEIADLSFWRSSIYEEYFEYLDKSNGFFYERWGDAPVHSIAVSLFEDKQKIHWFHDHGYKHHPYVNCPDEPGTTRCRENTFAPGQPWLNNQDCRASWFENIGII